MCDGEAQGGWREYRGWCLDDGVFAVQEILRPRFCRPQTSDTVIICESGGEHMHVGRPHVGELGRITN